MLVSRSIQSQSTSSTAGPGTQWETMGSGKGLVLGSSPSSHAQEAVKPTQGPERETCPSMAPEPSLETSVLVVEPEIALRFGPNPSQPWSKISSAYPGINPVTRQDLF